MARHPVESAKSFPALIEREKMIPNRKISEVILEFGDPLLEELSEDHDKIELEGMLRLIILTWNAVTLDQWHKTRNNEDELLKALREAPAGFQTITKKLIKRKKRKYSSDPRAVGNYSVVEKDDGYSLRAEAKLSVEHVDAGDVVH